VTSGSQTTQYDKGKHRTRRQQHADEVFRTGLCRNSFGQSGEAIPQFRGTDTASEFSGNKLRFVAKILEARGIAGATPQER
jgi:hypothetical protein